MRLGCVEPSAAKYDSIMSKTAVIVAMVLALVLGVGVLLTTPRDGSPNERGSKRASVTAPGGDAGSAMGGDQAALAFDAARVNGLLVQAGSRVDRLERRASGEWWLRVGDGGAGKATSAGTSWPIDPSAVRGLLRILSQASTGEPATGALASDATRVTLAFDDGTTRELRVDTRPLGGRVMLAAWDASANQATSQVWMTGELHDALATAGPRAWRDATAMPGLGPETARLRILGASGDVKLTRVQGQWGLTSPVSHAADAQAVAKLIDALARLRIEDFLDGKEVSETAFENSPLQIAAESDLREIVGDKAVTTTRARHLTIGTPAGLGAPRVHARLETIDVRRGESTEPVRQSVAFLLDAEALAKLKIDPATLLPKTSLAMPPGDVARLELVSGAKAEGAAASAVFARTSAGWERGAGGPGGGAGMPTAGREPMVGVEAEKVAALVGWICESPADATEIAATTPKFEKPVRLRIFGASSGDAPIATLTLAMTRGEAPSARSGAGTLIVADGQVVREFRSPTAIDLYAWLQQAEANASKKR